MDYYYSSDEDIAWGPLTLREIKKQVQGKGVKIRRRETDVGQYTFHSCDNTIELNSSEYFTPNETIQSKPSPPPSPKHDGIFEIACSRKTADNLDNIHQTLVENTVLLSDSENELNLHSTIEEVSEENISSSVLVISDESFDESFKAPKYEQYPPCVKQELMSRIDDDNSMLSTDYSFHEPQKSTLEEETEEERKRNSRINSVTTDLDRLNISYSSTKSDPSDASTSFNFNDTLEEMEMALKDGLDYVMPSDLSRKPSPEKIITPSPVPRTIQKNPADKFNYLRSPVGDYINSKSINSAFKLPTIPKNKAATPKTRSPQCHPQAFKNVVSPIGVYIKNSPRVCLKQNIQAPRNKSVEVGIKTESSPLRTHNKENNPSVLPKLVYKPAKQAIINSNKKIMLPGNIKKLLPEPIVMGHQQRLKNNDNNSSISRNLLEDDITCASFDSSQSAVDISYLESKQAFIK